MILLKYMVLPKVKKIFLLVLLVLVSFVLSTINFISGEKTSNARAAGCWTAPSPGSTGGSGSTCSCSGTGSGGSGGSGGCGY